MESFNVNEYNEESKEVLRKVTEEIREQYLVNGRQHQFWFFPAQASNKELTEPIIQKWLDVLSGKGVLRYFKPTGDFEVRQILALNQGCLEEGYAWESHMLTPFITGLPGHPFSGFALDIFNTDLDAVIEAISRKIKCEDLSKDNLGRFFYGNTELKEINCSPIRRAVLDELLRSKNHTITAEKISELLDQLHYKYPDNTHTRVKVMSETKQALRGVSHNVDIEPGKSGRNVDYYELVIKKESF